MKSKKCPSKIGNYIVRCMETEQDPQPVRVFMHPKAGLCVDDPDMGVNPIEHYHNNLVDITWEKVK